MKLREHFQSKNEEYTAVSESYVGIDKFVEALYPEAAREKAAQNYHMVDEQLFRQQGKPLIVATQAYWTEKPGEYTRHDAHRRYFFGFAMEENVDLDLAKKCAILRTTTLLWREDRPHFEDRAILLTERTVGRPAHLRNDVGYGLYRPLERRLTGSHLSEKRLAPYIGIYVGKTALLDLLKDEGDRLKHSTDRRTYEVLEKGIKGLGINTSPA